MRVDRIQWAQDKNECTGPWAHRLAIPNHEITESPPPDIATPNRIENTPQKLEHALHLPDRQNFVPDLLSSRCVVRWRQSEIDSMAVVVVVFFFFFFHVFKLLWTARREDRE
jgi:hypothetical protein